MKTQIGVWIDHRKAVLVRLQDGSETTFEVPSNVTPRVKLSGGSRSRVPYGTQNVVSETRRERRYALELKHYYQEVCERLRGADEILVFGPGDAKRELRDAVAGTSELAACDVTVESAEKMTDRQIAARVRTQFGVKKGNRKRPLAEATR